MSISPDTEVHGFLAALNAESGLQVVGPLHHRDVSVLGTYEEGILAKYSTPGLRKGELSRQSKKDQLNSQGMSKYPEDRDKILDRLYPVEMVLNSINATWSKVREPTKVWFDATGSIVVEWIDHTDVIAYGDVLLKIEHLEEAKKHGWNLLQMMTDNLICVTRR